MKNILISGGAGFIGSNLALKLVERGCNVRILDNLSPQIHGDIKELPDYLREKVEFIKGDVRDRKAWETALKGQDAVIHLAAETGTGQSMYEIHKYSEVNISGTALLLDILTNENHTIQKVVLASSRALYGEGRYRCREHGIVYPIARKSEDMDKGDFEVKCPICGSQVEICATTEDSLLHPTSIYGLTKHAQEQMIFISCKAIKVPCVAMRYQNVYGPGQSLLNPYTGILSIFSTRIQMNESINIFEDGKESRDFVYIDDVAEATIRATLSQEADYEIFNVGSGVMTDVNEVVETLCHAYNRMETERTITGNYRIGDIRHNYADISKMKNLLKFTPKVQFKDGIRRFSEWASQQNINGNSYEMSLAQLKSKGLMK